jgi:hypothetical protein
VCGGRVGWLWDGSEGLFGGRRVGLLYGGRVGLYCGGLVYGDGVGRVGLFDEDVIGVIEGESDDIGGEVVETGEVVEEIVTGVEDEEAAHRPALHTVSSGQAVHCRPTVIIDPGPFPAGP